jgi:hypothetical protein
MSLTTVTRYRGSDLRLCNGHKRFFGVSNNLHSRIPEPICRTTVGPSARGADCSSGSLVRRRGSRGEAMPATNRILLGALAGIAATCAMTATARAMHRRLPAVERYPLPPREIVESSLPVATKRSLDEHGRQTATIAAHFGYGPLPVRCTRLPRREAAFCRALRTASWSGSCELFRDHARPSDPSASARPSRAPQRAHDRGAPGLGQHAGEDAARPAIRRAGDLCR